MTVQNVPGERFRILLACARPMAARIVKLKVRLVANDVEKVRETHAALISLLEEKMKLAVLREEIEADSVTFELSAPLPDLGYLESEVRKCTGVLGVSHAPDGRPVDVNQPGEELQAILNGFNSSSSSVEVTLLGHVRPQELRDCLETAPGYDALILSCHGNRAGILLLEDGRGWTRYVSPGELAGIVGGKVKVLFVGACYGERSLRTLFDLEEGQRPSTIIFSEDKFPIQSRAVHLFIEGFCRALAHGEDSSAAFRKGVDRVRWDDHIGEVACPDGMPDDRGPSPFRRFQINEKQSQAFPCMTKGVVELRDPGRAVPPHRRIIRAGELMMGREIVTALLMDELLPPIGGIRQEKSRLVHLHGEGGIGKTRLAQTVCDALEDYRHFPGGIYELDCESIPDSRHLAVSILKAIGVDEAGMPPDLIPGLTDALNQLCSSAGDVLLMLDNVDPLFSGAGAEDTARLLKKIFSECAQVRILSTCRTQLGLGGYESDFIVDQLDPESAIDLFLHSIPDYDVQSQVRHLPEEDKQHVFSLVGALQGHPLSIFLAAHRIVAEADPIVRQLKQAKKTLMEFLDAPELRGVLARQRSLRASLDLSYNLLSDSGKEFFRKSSLFPGGLYRDYSTLDELLGEEWRECAKEAAGIGLIRFDREKQWYWMLNPVREYAERLLDGAEGNAYRIEVSEHWAGYTAMLDFRLNPAKNPEQMAELDLPQDALERQGKLARLHDNAFAVLKAEEANILFSYRWALENHVMAAEKIATRMMDYLNMCGKRRVNAWMAGAILNACAEDRLRSKWLNNLGNRLSEMGDRQGALDCFRENLIVARRASHLTGNASIAVQALARAAQFLSKTSPNPESLLLYEEAADILDPIAEEHCGAFQYLIEINESRVRLLELLDPPKAQQVAAELEQQKRAYQEKCKAG
ncbi:MAG: AAA family ATPase [Syntrophobacteraceae bacterium]